ncbi:hypothetical protein CDL15_Pgr024429 [Punica granatum]|uniref:Uncharacterized protein n=1 Tax=Punica granatum TaxID=22663 RepID=A0A218XYT8_PUNGR|nr:hypothetical protein CDL15_Pgr024429 [Punica granatum]
MAITYPVLSSSSSSAAFPISAPSPSSSSSWAPFVITQKEINNFYNIDRTVYTRLVIHLHRNPVGSMHVIALWIWFERLGCHKENLVNQMLEFPDGKISVLADEAATCLMYIEHKDLPPENDQQQIPMTLRLTGAPLSLRFFYENRDEIMSTILNIVNDVCIKAFLDIMQEATRLQTINSSKNHNNCLENKNTSTNFQVPNMNAHTDFHYSKPNLVPNFHGPNPNPGASIQVPNPNPSSGFFANNPRDTSLRATTKPSYNSPEVSLPLSFPYFTNPTMSPTGTALSSSSYNATQVSASPLVREGGFSNLLTKPSHDQYKIDDHRELLKNEITKMLNGSRLEV